MRSHSSTSPSIESIPVNKGVVILTGYGLDVRVNRGYLCLKDGIADQRREARFTKATCKIKRLVILGHSGTISLEASRWLHDIKAAVAQIDADGKVILASAPPKVDNVHLRRAQAMAYDRAAGLDIIRGLIARKIEGQASIAAQLGGEYESDKILSRLPALENETDIDAIRSIEGQAAMVYWNMWVNVSIQYVKSDTKETPDHWHRFIQRRSPLTNSQRNASNPVNALLNYLYAILEAETRIAILLIGLDPGMGFLHRDLKNRDSLALDIMEAARPDVDVWLLKFLRNTTFRRKDFFERRDGTVRISSKVTQILAQTAPYWAQAVAPVVEWVAKRLYQSRSKKSTDQFPTPLTQAHRAAGREALGTRWMKGTSTETTILDKCKHCGKPANWGMSGYCSRECYYDFVKD